jgi:NIMA (never in mitosis gene a)-related kinase
MSLNNFILGKQLGKGAFGSVRIVTRKEDKKIYAMKSVNIGKLDNTEKEASLNEVRILASLNHPNIIGYKEAFYDEPSKSLNIIMEYADDGDIAHKIKDNIKRRVRFDESTLWEWIIQILEGIKYLHDNKIMHRDLKCANIFLMKTGQVKIGDLNVSKLAKNNMARTQTGTPFYLAPEI